VSKNITITEQGKCAVFLKLHRISSGRKHPETKQRFRGVNWILVMGVRFVGNVANKSVVSILSSMASEREMPLEPYAVIPFSLDLTDNPPALLTSQQRTVQSAPPLAKTVDSALKARL